MEGHVTERSAWSTAALKTKPSIAEGTIGLAETAYQLVLDGLFNRRIATGTVISQNELVELLGVPLQPLRAALRVIEIEGLVEIHPRVGISFIRPDMELIRSTYQFRMIIEGDAVRNCAERAPTEEIEALLGDHEELIEELERGDLDSLARFHRLEHCLHGGLIGRLANPLIESTTKCLQNYTTLIRMDRRETLPLISQTLKEHVRILAACRDRNVELAASEMAAHLNTDMHRAMGL
jgi:DNA-binding GntR family transcriptional regulator